MVRKKSKTADIPSARSLIAQSWRTLWANRKTFIIFTVIYGLLIVILVQGPQFTTVAEIQSKITETLPNSYDDPTLVAGILVGETSKLEEASAVYGLFMFLIFTLAMIWLLRAAYEGKKVRVRDGFYQGMPGLVPVVLIAVLMILQLVPVALGGLVYSVVSANSIATNGLEVALTWAVFGLLCLLSLHFLAASTQAIYIASLPNVTPMEAIRQSRKIVKGRRAKIMARMIVGGLAYGLVAFLGLLLIITVLPVAAPWWWWLIGLLILPIGQSYNYALYRSLL